MDERLKKLNDRIAVLRQAYDQVETTAENLFHEMQKRTDGEVGYMAMLAGIASSEDATVDTRAVSCMAQFGVMRLLLNEAERQHADILLGIE